MNAACPFGALLTCPSPLGFIRFIYWTKYQQTISANLFSSPRPACIPFVLSPRSCCFVGCVFISEPCRVCDEQCAGLEVAVRCQRRALPTVYLVHMAALPHMPRPCFSFLGCLSANLRVRYCKFYVNKSSFSKDRSIMLQLIDEAFLSPKFDQHHVRCSPQSPLSLICAHP